MMPIDQAKAHALAEAKALTVAIGKFTGAADQYLDKLLNNVQYYDQPSALLERCLERAERLNSDLTKAIQSLE